MSKQVVIKETARTPKKVTQLCIGKTYKIRTSRALFARAKVVDKKKGAVVLVFFGAPRDGHLRKPNTPLFKALQPVRQEEKLSINLILEAQEVV